MKRTLLVVSNLVLALLLGCLSALAAKKQSRPAAAPGKSAAVKVTARSTAPSLARRSKTAAAKPAATKQRAKSRLRRPRYNPWITPNFADSTWGDVVDGEDLTVRRAAVEALGPFNGSVVVADPNSGRILTIVNQKLALTGAYQPCSTIKLVAGLAGLSEGLIDRETQLRLGRRSSMNLTTALAKSNNPYFATVGEKLGFEKVNHYARLLGLGEKAGLNIEGESSGVFPDEKPKSVPVGMMTSFGESIGLTPLQLTAIVSSIANGGTLYYLQYPRNQEEAAVLVPRVKRQLEFTAQIPEMLPGMMGAVDFGTARRAMYDASEPIFGKTGTCTEARTHLGWFGSFNEVGKNKLVVVVLLTGGKLVNGPAAAGIAGQVYKNLSQQQFFAQTRPATAAITDSSPR